MSVFRYIARLLLLIALLHLPALQMEMGVAGFVPAWASDDDGDDGGGDDGGGDSDGDDGHGGGGDHGGNDGHDGDEDDHHGGGEHAGGYYHDDDDEDDAEHARHARKKGKLLPLWVVMRSAKRKVPGKVLSVKLHRKGGRYYYHFRILDRRNHVRSLHVPASGRLKMQNWNSRR